MYTALQVADWFRGAVDRDAGDAITHLKLQKLVYYAQAWSLALLGRPPFAEDFRAWAHGPVVLSVWHEFKGHGWEALPPPAELPELDDEAAELLRDLLRRGWRARRSGSPETAATTSSPPDADTESEKTVYHPEGTEVTEKRSASSVTSVTSVPSG